MQKRSTIYEQNLSLYLHETNPRHYCFSPLLSHLTTAGLIGWLKRLL